MSTITCKVSLSKSDKRFTRNVMSGSSNYAVEDIQMNSMRIASGGGPNTHTFANLCVANFSSKTLIQIVDGEVTIEKEVIGNLMLPFAGTLIVAHPGVSLTSPIVYDIFTA